MTGYVYLIRNKDLYKIGVTKDFETRMKVLKPNEIIKVLKVDSYRELEKRLHRRFKHSRIPQTEYFRLSKSQISSCKKFLTISYERRSNCYPLLIGLISISISPICSFFWSFRLKSLYLGLIALTATILLIYIYPNYEFNQSVKLIIKILLSFISYIISKWHKGQAIK